MTFPPTYHGCCRTPCFYEYNADEETPCWGEIICVDTGLVETDDGSYDEYRYGACEGHIEMYRTYKKSDYIKPNAS
jgi:hypothetical protein